MVAAGAQQQQQQQQQQLYSAEGQHDMVGYYVKTVGDAPVTIPTPLSPEQQAAAQASVVHAGGGGSAWNRSGATWETRDLRYSCLALQVSIRDTSIIAPCFMRAFPVHLTENMHE